MIKKVNYNLKIILFLCIISVVLDFFLSIMFHFGVNPKILKSVYYFRDGVVLLYGIKSLIQIIYCEEIEKQDIILIVMILLMVMYFFVGNYPILSRLASFRSYIIPFFLYFIGKSISISHENNKYILHKVNVVSVIFIITSFIDKLFLPTSFWSDFIQISYYNAAVKGVVNVYSIGGLPGNFFTANTRRVLGLATEPLALSYFLIVIFFVLFYDYILNKNKKSLILSMLVFVVQVLTITRAVIISTIMAILITYITNKKINKKNLLKILVIGFVCIIPFTSQIYGLVMKTITFNDGGSSEAHYNSTFMGIKLIENNMLGKGIGGGSTAAAALSVTQNAVTTENSFINLSIELGVLGLMLFLIFFLLSIKKIKNNYNSNRKNEFNIIYLATYSTVIAWFVTGVFSPQMWVVKASGIFWFFYGLAQNSFHKKEEVNKR